MADTPTRSLRAATNPQARMQELLSRDQTPTPAAAELLPPTEISSVVADATSNIDSITVAQTTDSAEADATYSKAVQTRRRKHSPKEKTPAVQTTSNTVAQTTSSAVGSATRKPKNFSGGDPVREAMLGMLAQPYPADMQERAMTVTSVKIPKPIWERLEYARAITKQDKQDIIAEALRLYFDRLVQGEGE